MVNRRYKGRISDATIEASVLRIGRKIELGAAIRRPQSLSISYTATKKILCSVFYKSANRNLRRVLPLRLALVRIDVGLNTPDVAPSSKTTDVFSPS